MTLEDLPLLNACLNAAAALCLALGYAAIRKRRVGLHRAAMGSAVLVSAAFLTSYLIYHSFVGTTRFSHAGWPRTIYLAILLTHTVLAATLPVLVPLTLWRAIRGEFARHRRLARWTLPIWFYVSVTGVVIYLMLYVWYPPSAA